GKRVRHHILLDDAVRPDEGVPSDPAELVDSAEGADVRPVLDDDMARKPHAVAQDHVVTDADVVSDVGVDHQQVVIADAGDQAAALGAAMDRDKLANAVAVPDPGFGALALILQVLRGNPDGAVWEKDVI